MFIEYSPFHIYRFVHDLIEVFFILVFTEILTCPKALTSAENETPLLGRRTNGISDGGVILKI